MPNSGTYLLTNVGFSSNEKPTLLLQADSSFVSMEPIGLSFTLSFDTSQRYCIGWRDMTKGERYVCPDSQPTAMKYEQCSACQQRTGFNPAFYRAVTVSAQQEARNLEPHILYLAYFGPGIIKVGISHAKRGYARLLEQGARSALIISELPTAHIARQYEAQIAKIPGISESIQLKKKLSVLTAVYDRVTAEQELTAAMKDIERVTDRQFGEYGVLHFDDRYFSGEAPDLSFAFSSAKHHELSGFGLGMIGSVLFCSQQENILYLPVKQYVGYKFILTNEVTSIDAPAQQTSLF